jgi:membrane protein DedA with SNARE-associated domain
MEHFLLTWGYLGIFVLTVLESACIPIPSEVTLALGGALCSSAFLSSTSSTDAPLNLVAVILVAIAGSLVGSFIAYVVGRTGGRAIVDRWGKYVLLSHADLDKSEAWFKKRGPITVLIGRIVPVVRTFISFPAGMAEMEPISFGIFTTIGCAIWVTVLTLLGYHLGDQYHKWTKGISYAGYLVALAIVVVIACADRDLLILSPG